MEFQTLNWKWFWILKINLNMGDTVSLRTIMPSILQYLSCYLYFLINFFYGFSERPEWQLQSLNSRERRFFHPMQSHYMGSYINLINKEFRFNASPSFQQAAVSFLNLLQQDSYSTTIWQKLTNYKAFWKFVLLGCQSISFSVRRRECSPLPIWSVGTWHIYYSAVAEVLFPCQDWIYLSFTSYCTGKSVICSTLNTESSLRIFKAICITISFLLTLIPS